MKRPAYLAVAMVLFASTLSVNIGAAQKAAGGDSKLLPSFPHKPGSHAISLSPQLAKIYGTKKIEYDVVSTSGHEVHGRVTKPLSITPFKTAGIPGLKTLTMRDLEVVGPIGSDGSPVITAENMEVSGIVTYEKLTAYTTITTGKSKASDGIAMRMQAPAPTSVVTDDSLLGKAKGHLVKQLSESVRISDVLPVLDGKSFAEVACKQLVLIFSTYEFDAQVDQFGQSTKLHVGPHFNLVAEIDSLKATDIYGGFVGSSLEKVDFKDVSIEVLKVKDMSNLNTQPPAMRATGKLDLSAVDLPALPIRRGVADFTMTFDGERASISIAVPDKVSIAQVGVLSDVRINFGFAVDNREQKSDAAVNSFDFNIQGRTSIPALSDQPLTVYLAMSPDALKNGTSFAEVTKNLKTTDLILATLADKVDFSGLVTRVAGDKAFTGKGRLLVYLKKLPRARVAYVRLPLPDGHENMQNLPVVMKANELSALLGDIGLTPAQRNALESVGEFTAGANIFGAAPQLALKELLPPAMQDATALTNLALEDPMLVIQNLSSLTQADSRVPQISFQGFIDFTALPVPGLSKKLPARIQFLSNSMLIIEASVPGDYQLPGIKQIGSLKDTRLKVVIDLAKKNYEILMDGMVPVTVPGVENKVDVGVEIKFHTDGFSGGGKITHPTKLTPFTTVSGASASIKNLVLEDPELDVAVKYNKPLVRGQKPDIKDVTVTIAGTIIDDELGLHGTAALDTVLGIHGKSGLVLRAYPKHLDISKLAPGLKGTPLENMDLEGSGVIVTTVPYRDAGLKTDLEANTISVTGKVSGKKLGKLIPKLAGTPVDQVTLERGSYTITNIGSQDGPGFELTGIFNFSSISIPMVQSDLSHLDGSISYSHATGLAVEAQWEESIHLLPSKGITLGTFTNPRLKFVIDAPLPVPRKGQRQLPPKSVGLVLHADGNVTFPIIGRKDVMLEIEITVGESLKKVVRRFRMEKPLTLGGIELKNAMVTIDQELQVADRSQPGRTELKQGIIVEGLSEYSGKQVHSVFDIWK